MSGTPATGTYSAVSAGGLNSVAIRTDGKLVSWGDNRFGQVSGTPAGTYSAVSAGGPASVAIRADGSLVSWGYDGFGVVSGTPATGNYSAVSAGSNNSVAIVVLTPAQATTILKHNVQALVDGGALLPADGNSLRAKLDAALSQLAKGHNNGAIGSLKDFISQVLALIHNGRLTSAQGQPLIDAAQDIISALGG